MSSTPSSSASPINLISLLTLPAVIFRHACFNPADVGENSTKISPPFEVRLEALTVNSVTSPFNSGVLIEPLKLSMLMFIFCFVDFFPIFILPKFI